MDCDAFPDLVVSSESIRLFLSWMPVVVVPVVVRAPSVGFDVPPSVAVIPTIFPRFVQFVTRMFGLAAVPTVMFDRFVEEIRSHPPTPRRHAA